jgi:itaconyl-CoA hydratase
VRPAGFIPREPDGLPAIEGTKMVKGVKEVGPQRYRETFGRYFEDFVVGDVYEHRPGKTVTEYDNHLFTLLTLNTHPMHFDAEFAKASEFKQNLVVSPYTLALCIGMSVTDTSQKAIANLGMDEVKFTAPVFAGDTLYAESEVLAKRESASRPGQGIVTIRTIGKNQRGEMVCTFKRNMLIPARGQAVEDKIDTY